ncbi:MAG: hypothetical protein V1726_04380 [Methanobacteriota archaeon]
MVYAIKLMVNDIRNILRDRFLLYAAVAAPIMFVVLSRAVIPYISENFYYLEPYYPLLFMLMVIMMPLMFGFITAFLIMDERDEHLLTVLRVMPISRNGYLMYRMILMIVLAFVFIIVFPVLTGLIEVDFWLYLPIAVLFALFTPVMALIVNILASNKVQAFAVFKTLGGVFFLPLFAFFTTNNIRYAFGVIPNFWSFMALDQVLTEGTQDYVSLFIGFVFHFALLAVLFHIFNKKF